MKAAISLLAIVTSVLAQSREFQEFQLTHNKIYKDENELQTRQRIFEVNKKIIDEHNKRFAKGLETYEMGVNKFTDLSPSEFQNRMLKNHRKNKTDRNNNYKGRFSSYSPTNHDIPESIDWVEKGAVTPAKDQGNCGSCWAFAAVATLEGQYFLTTGELLNFSEQNLLDCASKGDYDNDGCNGGFSEEALKYVLDNDGIQTGDTYKYETREDKCRYREEYRGTEIEDYVYSEPNDENLLANLVAEKGPVAVYMNSTFLKQYERGVYNGPCNNNTNHAVTLVGYGHDTNGGDYWLVKNSWGEDWGENGYLRIARNKENLCGIANKVTYPIIPKE